MRITEMDVSNWIDEELRVVLWRTAALTRAGYEREAALDLALNGDVDLHLATRLLEQGCAPDVAVRILL